MSDNLIWGLVLIGSGFVLGVIEIFIPSMGLIAAVAGLCAIAGIVALFQEGTAWGVTGIGVVIFGAISAFIFGIRIFPYTPMGRGLILGHHDEDEHPDEGLASRTERRELAQALEGASGVTLTALHPVGNAEIEGARIEVIARHGSIEKGTPVRVVEVRGNEIYVRADTGNSATA